uniref:Uncharacterized protein n=1 Tax=Cannabis sativa TaxID=3483 RepID=A0A803Q5Y8_CANSA
MVLIRRSSSTEAHNPMAIDPNVQAPTDLGVDNPYGGLPSQGNPHTVPANVNARAIEITTPFTRDDQPNFRHQDEGRKDDAPLRPTRGSRGFKMPTMKMYTGKEDPLSHIKYFKIQIDLHAVKGDVQCRIFLTTLANATKQWFIKLKEVVHRVDIVGQSKADPSPTLPTTATNTSVQPGQTFQPQTRNNSDHSGENEYMDPRFGDPSTSIKPVEEIEEVEIDPTMPTRKLKIGWGLLFEIKSTLIKSLRADLDNFSWSHEDMVGIDPFIISLALNIDPNFYLV